MQEILLVPRSLISIEHSHHFAIFTLFNTKVTNILTNPASTHQWVDKLRKWIDSNHFWMFFPEPTQRVYKVLSIFCLQIYFVHVLYHFIVVFKFILQPLLLLFCQLRDFSWEWVSHLLFRLFDRVVKVGSVLFGLSLLFLYHLSY